MTVVEGHAAKSVSRRDEACTPRGAPVKADGAPCHGWDVDEWARGIVSGTALQIFTELVCMVLD